MRLLIVVSIVKTLSALFVTRPMRFTRVASSLAVRVHVAVALAHRVRVVVVAEALVAAEADRDRLVPAVHRDEVQVHVDDEIALDRLAIELDDLALLGRADLLHPLRVFGVVVVEALGPVGVEDLAPTMWRTSGRSCGGGARWR
jgi:hypothetical protein